MFNYKALQILTYIHTCASIQRNKLQITNVTKSAHTHQKWLKITRYNAFQQLKLLVIDCHGSMHKCKKKKKNKKNADITQHNSPDLSTPASSGQHRNIYKSIRIATQLM